MRVGSGGTVVASNVMLPPMTEFHVARLSELEHDQPVEVNAGERRVLLVRRGDTVHALAATCPHRGVPLSKGAVVGDRIVCGVHRAAFALDTGELLSPPACENLAVYTVRLDGDDIVVDVPDDVEEHPLPRMTRPGGDERHIVIVGSGAAGWRAAETLRREGFAGKLSVVGDESGPLYDRTELSKGFLKPDGDGQPTVLRADDAIRAYGIERVHARATALDASARRLTLANGTTIDAHGIIVATGCAARRLDMPGAELPGVHVLRSLTDAQALRAALDTARRVVIVGGGFIGLEVASALCAHDDIGVTVVMREAAPMAGLFGEAFAARLAREHEANGVTFIGEADVASAQGNDRLETVRLGDGRELPADLLVMAVGAVPRTDWLPFTRDDDGGIPVDETLRVADGIFLAGDIARVPTPWGNVRIEHWRFAQETGELAARNLLGAKARYDSTPFFWSMQQIAGSYTLTGHQGKNDRPDGSVDEKDFRVDYRDGDRITAVLAHGIDDDVTRLEREMAGRGPIQAG